MTGRSTTLRLLVVAVAVLGTATAHAARDKVTLESRVERLENLMQSQGLMEMLTQLQQMQRELQKLRGEVEVQGHKLEQLQQRQRDLYVDIDRRLQQASPATGVTTIDPSTSMGMPATPGSVPSMPTTPVLQTPAAPPPAVRSPDQGAVDSVAERNDYEQALNILREGRYPEAAEAYRQFLARYPGSRYADNAQYWLAETHYVTRQFPQGLEAFGQVIANYPNSPKVPDAQLKIGYIQYELGNWKEARGQLEALVQRFPDSTAARLAGERLQRMTREGR